MLEYRIVPVIINDSLLKRTMKVVNLIFLVICESARPTTQMTVKFKDTYTKDSHNSRTKMMVFLGILDFSNCEGSSSIDSRWKERCSTVQTHCNCVWEGLIAYRNLLITRVQPNLQLENKIVSFSPCKTSLHFIDLCSQITVSIWITHAYSTFSQQLSPDNGHRAPPTPKV